MTASLQPIANLDVPALQGYTVPLLASSSSTGPQSYVVASSNPDITVATPQGAFWTVGVAYTDPTTPVNSFSGSLTFQLFQTLTPTTVSEITTLTNDGYFVNTGKFFSRIMTGFPNSSGYVVQGGSPTLTGEQTTSPVTFANENVQQLAFSGTDQLAMANAGGADSNSTQFFITTGSPNSQLGYNYTIFGQLISGQATLARITQLPLMKNSYTGETSEPENPLTITSAALTSTNPNGVAILDTTQARPGESATITVIAVDSTDHTHVAETFSVTVGAYGGPSSSSFIGNLTFKPYANPTTSSGLLGASQQLQLAGQSTFPDPSRPVSLSYSLVSNPKDGTISNFNAATGTFTYTPNPGFVGTDTFLYQVAAAGSSSTATSNAGTVTISVIEPAVTLSNVQLVMNKKHQVMGVTVAFSGALDVNEANNKAFYRLATPGKRGSYTAKNAGIIHLKTVVYSRGSNRVTLMAAKPFNLRKPVQLLIHGSAPAGLQDSEGRYLDAALSGNAGTDAIAILFKNNVVIQAL